jgi:soluble lytic murein transglycosylase
MKQTIIMVLMLILVSYSIPYKDICAYSKKVANYYKVPHEIVLAVIKAESNFKQDAVSPKQAYGLMQVTRQCYEHYRDKNPKTCSTWITNFDVIKNNWKANINTGIWYLKTCYKKHQNWKDAITAFFWGIDNKKKTYRYYATVVKKSNLKLPILD